ncbi:hypothetical protein K439DRAFT_1557345 [Ramaria rubella]|nr:hypothetical protein K439DRAFT_1557345 [Ramaria rubella]
MASADRPRGASVPGPSGIVPDLSPRRSPRHSSRPPTATVTHVSDVELEILKDLIARTELNNVRIKKLNRLRQILRDDPNHTDPVSDDDEEDPLPIVSSYMRTNVPPSSPPNPDPLFSHPQGLSSVALGKRPASNAPGTTPVDWRSLMSHSNPTPIDYHSLPPIFSDSALTKELKLHVTSIPASILQMAFNKLYIPLFMLTTSTLNRIRNNENLKFKKIPFGDGAGKQSLDESQFPLESSLTVSLFFQSYRNWLAVVDSISTPQLAVGWYEHHAQMLADEDFDSSFAAWRDHDKQLHSQYMASR